MWSFKGNHAVSWTRSVSDFSGRLYESRTALYRLNGDFFPQPSQSYSHDRYKLGLCFGCFPIRFPYVFVGKIMLLRLCAHGRRFRAFSKTFSSLLSFWRPVYTDQGKIFSMYWISSNFCSKLLVFASVFAWKHKWKRSKTLPCARSLSYLIMSS